MIRLAVFFFVLTGLAACNEPDQSLYSSSAKVDGKPWQGAQNGFVTSGWQPGDKARWETQIRNRAQTQNEYLKVR